MNLILAIEEAQKKSKVASIKTGDTVKVHQTIREGNKSRIQIFEGLVIRYRKPNSLQAFITVRKITSGVGVEKSWFVHSPNVVKIEIVRRAKVRRAFISYMRGLQGKKARLAELTFDKQTANQADNQTMARADDKTIENDETAPAEIVKSTQELAKDEVKKATKDDPEYDETVTGQDEQDLKNAQGDDEALLPAEEIATGLEKAEEEDTKKQK